MKTAIEMASEVLDRMAPDDHCSAPYWTATDEELERLVELVRADERKIIYDIALYAAFRDGADLLMPETEVDEDSADDFFRSSEFRYAMNNTVKATVFVITGAIRKRGSV